MDSCFSGKKAVVIGGSSGIGRAISVSLSNEGARVFTQGRHELPGTHSQVLDLDIPKNREIVLASVKDADILCIVRGPFLQKSLQDTDPEDWVSIVYANLSFPGMLVSAALPHMCRQKWGRILLFGGTRTETVRGFRTNAAYAAAKTGLSSLVKSVALEYAATGITCNAICPGFVDTDSLDVAERMLLAKKNPDGRLVTIPEIADASLYLLKNTVFNGVLLPVDKGWSPVPI